MRAAGGKGRGEAAGFTLLELAVALALLGVAMTLVFGIFRLQRSAFDRQAEEARMRRDLSAAMTFLEGDLRRAGFGLPAGVEVGVPEELSGDPAVRMVAGLGVTDGGAASPDRLFVAYLTAEPTRLAEDMPGAAGELEVADAGSFREGDLAIVFDAEAADLFRVARVDGGRLAQGGGGIPPHRLSKAYAAGAQVARAAYAGYRVDAGRKPVEAALLRTTAGADGGPHSVPVAEGIEDLQVRLVQGGSERDGDGLAGDPSLLAEAAGVRIHLTARSGVAAPGSDEGPAARWNRTDVSTLEPFRGHRRRHMEGLFDLRNRRSRR